MGKSVSKVIAALLIGVLLPLSNSMQIVNAANPDDGYPKDQPAPGRTCPNSDAGASTVSDHNGKTFICTLINGEKKWVFHGDVFDATTKGSAKIIAKLGGQGYDLLILMNRAINWILKSLGREKMSLSKKVKNSVKKAVKFINDFEKTAADIAISNQYDYVICGHIHHPEIKNITTENGNVVYMNSGDWCENCTALVEDYEGKWTIINFHL